MNDRVNNQFDVIVAGGGSAGVAAAISASRAGARTLLLERGPCLGGAATLRNVVTYCGLYTRDDERQVVFGVADDLLTRLKTAGAVTEPRKFHAVTVVFDPESVKFHLDQMCQEAGVEVRLHSLIVGASVVDDRVEAVQVADHEGLHWIHADVFVDTSGDADLAQHSGAEVRYGHDGRVQNGSLGVRFGGLSAEAVADRNTFSAAIRKAKGLGIEHLNSETGLVSRMPISGDLITYVVDEGYDARSAVETSRAEASGRAQAQSYLAALRLIPGCEEAFIVTTGPELGTRESRHIIAPRQLTEDEVLHPAPAADDTVAIGAWPMEYHPGPAIPSEWKFIDDPGYYGIPLDALRSVNRSNLFAGGRTVDGDRGAGASLRVMGTAFATGQAAGVAAALHSRDGIADVGKVRTELRRQKVWLPVSEQVQAA
jgi:hypothetical protein